MSLTVRQSLVGSETDDMVLLHSYNKAMGTLPPGITRLMYRRKEDIQTFLSLPKGTNIPLKAMFKTSDQRSVSNLTRTIAKYTRPLPEANVVTHPESDINLPKSDTTIKSESSASHAASTIDRLDLSNAAENREIDHDGGEIDQDGIEDHQDGVEQAQSTQVVPEDDSEMPQYQPASEPSIEEHDAAAMIQANFRRFMTRRQDRERATKKYKATLPFHESCLEASKKLGTIPRKYRLLFLGPLAHLLSCIDIVRLAAAAHKVTTKKKLAEASPSDYDVVDAELTEAV